MNELTSLSGHRVPRSWGGCVSGAAAACLLALAPGCGGGSSASVSEANDPEAANPYGCADIYAQNLLPSFSIDIAPAEWDAINAEFQDWKGRRDATLEIKPYHPVVFHYGDETYDDAFIKLQGNPSTSWIGDKLQFTVAFDKIEPDKRFHGQKKIVLHAAPSDQTFLRERVALSYLRSLGLAAGCENNARLTVNGAFYGVYANREPPEQPYLDRVFPDAAGGDMWKGGYTLDNNQEETNHPRHDQLMNTPTLEGFQQMVDVDASLLEWAAEAVMPDNDGYWAIAHNFYLYDHPTRGFIWLPYDVDATFDFSPFDVDPITWMPSWSQGWGAHQRIVLADPALTERYVAALERALAGYDVDLLKSRLLRWSDQIAGAVGDDHQKPFATGDHELAVARMSGSFWLRQKYLTSWVECYRTGNGVDADGDGFVWCRDCNDKAADQNPGAAEVCGNDVDENCNGRKDDCQ